MKKEWEANLKENRQTVDAEEIANVISMMSGIPVQRMAQAEGIKLAGMKEDLQAKVIDTRHSDRKAGQSHFAKPCRTQRS